LGYLHGHPVSYSDREVGVYELTHVDSQKVYVGSTIDLYNRCGIHMRQLAKGAHPNCNLQEAYNQSPHFELSFEPVPLADKKLLIQKEQNLLDLYHDSGFLLNIATDAEVSARGLPVSEERRLHLSAMSTGRVKSDEEREKLRQGRLGKTQSEEAREKIRQARLGKPLSEEHRRKIAEAGIGRIHSEESILKMRENHHRLTPVEIEGREYPSLATAARALDLTPATVRGRLQSKNKLYQDWSYKTEAES
jgi:group I intron endonuclease